MAQKQVEALRDARDAPEPHVWVCSTRVTYDGAREDSSASRKITLSKDCIVTCYLDLPRGRFLAAPRSVKAVRQLLGSSASQLTRSARQLASQPPSQSVSKLAVSQSVSQPDAVSEAGKSS